MSCDVGEYHLDNESPAMRYPAYGLARGIGTLCQNGNLPTWGPKKEI